MLMEIKERLYLESITFVKTIESIRDVTQGAKCGDVGTALTIHGTFAECSHRFAVDLHFMANLVVDWDEDRSAKELDSRKICKIVLIYVEVPKVVDRTAKCLAG